MSTLGMIESVSDCTTVDQAGWERIVERYSPLIWTIARGHRLSAADCDDVSQTTWMRVFEHLDQLRDPERLTQWISVSARRESLKHIRKNVRNLPVGSLPVFDRPEPPENAPEAVALAKERAKEVLLAYCDLSPQCQSLLGLLMTDPPMSYDEVSATLSLPRGSIGPLRSRCLARLKKFLMEEQGSPRADELVDAITRAGLRTHALSTVPDLDS